MTYVVTVFDTETSGLVHNRSLSLDLQPEVIEFYGVTVDLDKLVKAKKPPRPIAELETLIKPRTPLSEVKTGGKRTITDITGIDDSMLSDAPPFSGVADRIISFLEGSPVAVAQNASFDRDMIDIEAERLDRVVKWPPMICTVEQSLWYIGRRLNLGELHEHLLGMKFPGAHRARADVEALVRCCVEMRRRCDL